jgi:hypothetical protein
VTQHYPVPATAMDTVCPECSIAGHSGRGPRLAPVPERKSLARAHVTGMVDSSGTGRVAARAVGNR